MTSIAGLQAENTIRPWRKCEIKRRSGSTYETDWVDVSKYVTRWPTISFEADIINSFDYRIGTAVMSFRNEDKQFSDENTLGSLFYGKLTRFKTLVKISTGLRDENGTAYPTTASQQSQFFGVVEDVNDTETESTFTVLSTMSILNTLPASVIALQLVGYNKTATEIITYFRDLVDSNLNYVLQPFISSSAWLLTCTGDTYMVTTSTSLDNMTAFQMISNLAKSENHTFWIDKAGNFSFKPRTVSSTSSYTFNGPGERGVNIEALEGFNQGVNNVYSKITCNISATIKVYSSEVYTVGDASSSWKYGVREFSWDNPWTTAGNAVSQNNRLLVELVTPKKEIQVRTKYIAPNLDIYNRVTVNYKGEKGGDSSTWDNFKWDVGLWSDEHGGIFISNGKYKILGIKVNMNEYYTTFNLKEI